MERMMRELDARQKKFEVIGIKLQDTSQTDKYRCETATDIFEILKPSNGFDKNHELANLLEKQFVSNPDAVIRLGVANGWEWKVSLIKSEKTETAEEETPDPETNNPTVRYYDMVLEVEDGWVTSVGGVSPKFWELWRNEKRRMKSTGWVVEKNGGDWEAYIAVKYAPRVSSEFAEMVAKA